MTPPDADEAVTLYVEPGGSFGAYLRRDEGDIQYRALPIYDYQQLLSRVASLEGALREAREYVEAFDVDGECATFALTTVSVDIPDSGYACQYAVNAAHGTLARIDAALAGGAKS